MKSIILSIIAVLSTLFLSNAVLSDDENYETSNLEKLCQKSPQNSLCKNKNNFISLDERDGYELDCQLSPSLFTTVEKCKVLENDRQLIVYIEEKTSEHLDVKNIKEIKISLDDIFVFNSQWWLGDTNLLFKKVENSFGLFSGIEIGFIDRSTPKYSSSNGSSSKFLTMSFSNSGNINKILEKVESWRYYLPDRSTLEQEFNNNQEDINHHNSIVNHRAIKRLLETNECPYCDLRNANLVNADLEGANLEGAILSGANLEKANLKNAYLVNAQLDNANLFQANLEEAKLTFASLASATLVESSLKIANLQYANLEGADLSKSNLEGQKFRATYLNNANLDNAKLNEATLKCVNLQSASLKNTKLVEANLSNCTIKRRGNRGLPAISNSVNNERLNRANVSKSDYLPEHILSLSPIVGFLFAGADKFSLSSNLSGANLNGANLIGTDLTGVNLTDANLSHANLDSTELKDANLSNTNMINANISNANFQNSNLCDAIMPDLSISEQGCIQDKQDSKPNEKSEAEEESKAEED